jgi:cell division protein FtsQ
MPKRKLPAGSQQPARRPGKSSAGATRKVAAKEKLSGSHTWINRLLILVGVGVVLTALANAAVWLHGIPVERIVVTGKLERTRKIALQDMVQPELVGGFLSADLQRIREQLESLPWVYEVAVRRQWPSALTIHVVEQLPIARWGKRGYLNHEGEVFQSSLESEAGVLPLLTGPDGTQRKLIGDYQLVSDTLLPLSLSVESLTVDSRGQLRVFLAEGIEILFGDVELVDRLNRFVALYRVSQVEQKALIRRVDLRYQNGLAVAFEALPEKTELAKI